MSAANVLQLGTYKVYVITWNVGTEFPDKVSLKTLFGLPETAEEEHRLPDIYAFGLMEVNSKPQQQVMDLFKADPWTLKASRTLKAYDYIEIQSEHMQGLLISVFVRRVHIPHLRDIQSEFTRTGFGGLWGNKGAVSVRFNLYGCALVFVAAHLAAHDHNLAERVEDYNQILENHHYHVKQYKEIHDHDYVFWFGDLNFRLQGDDSSAEVLAAVKEERYEELFERDQLQHVRLKTQEAFQLLREGVPTFAPTFKFKEGTNDYNLKRRPAWCDRILYAVQPLNLQPNRSLNIEQHSYKSYPEYSISDHKPVTADFTIKLFPNYQRPPCVTFRTIPVWMVGEKNTVEYHKPLGFEERGFDWIGIFHVRFTSFTEHIDFEYVSEGESPAPQKQDAEPDFNAPPRTHRHDGKQSRDRPCKQTELHADGETIRLDFSDDTELIHGQQYLLIYFQDSDFGHHSVTSVAGLSNIFEAQKRNYKPTDTIELTQLCSVCLLFLESERRHTAGQPLPKAPRHVTQIELTHL